MGGIDQFGCHSEGGKRLVYFVSRVLHGAKVRYTVVEKVVLTLVTSTRRLLPNVLNYQIVVQTDYPLSSILGKADVSGRMVKWAVEMGQFDISCERRTMINAQANFVQETTRAIEEQVWELYMDGSATKQKKLTRGMSSPPFYGLTVLLQRRQLEKLLLAWFLGRKL